MGLTRYCSSDNSASWTEPVRRMCVFHIETPHAVDHLQRLVDQFQGQNEQSGAEIVTFSLGPCAPQRQSLLAPLLDALLHLVCGCHVKQEHVVIPHDIVEFLFWGCTCVNHMLLHTTPFLMCFKCV